MNRIMKERREDIAAAMRGLCDAVGHLSLVRDDLVRSLETLPPGHEDERLALTLSRACGELARAAACMPNECWDALIAYNAAGGHEVRKRVQEMLVIHEADISGLAVPA